MISGGGDPAVTGALRLQALEAASEALGSADALERVAPRVLAVICRELGWSVAVAWLVDRAGETLRPFAFWSADPGDFAQFEAQTRGSVFALDEGLPGRVYTSRAAVWIEDVASDPNLPRRPVAIREGLRAAIGFPIALENDVVGVMEFFTTRSAPRDASILGMLQIVGAEVGLLIERVRAEERSKRSEERLRRTVNMLAAERRILEMVARGQPLPAALSELTRTIEELCPGIRASVLLLDRDGVHLRTGAAPNVPAAWSQAIDGLPIGPDMGACGTAAYTKQTVVAADIAEDPRWARWRDLALRLGLRACWSAPILDANLTVLGTFAMYYGQPRAPDPEHLMLIEAAAHVARIAIERHGRDVERAKLIEDLQRAVRFTELFVGVLGHDLRNPLNAVINGAQLLEIGGEPATVKRVAERIFSSGVRMSRMIDQLLDFTRIRLGQGVPLDPRPADFADICQLAIEELRANQSDREIAVHREGDTVGTWDHDRVLQLVSNLVGNALQHGSKAGKIQVSIDGKHPEVLSFAVTNAGSIPEAHLAGIFDPFKREAEPSPDWRPAGLGLGLYISREVARAHGGSIDLTTTPESTCFRVDLPRRPSRASFLPSAD